ncbi:MAG TPA: histidine kinase dimerization/phospho-acceptor domain-containing protein, partial [Burkholderiales bacterium]|nr:histidine kinase dimerization/phospho-acceptor domain-containing protein [Burkholderiales bacterium]
MRRACGGSEMADRREAEHALRTADRRKDEFLATLAHELRNPLAPIRNALYLMQLPHAQPGAVAEARAIVERQLAQMVRLVD